jgi:protein SCO1/2
MSSPSPKNQVIVWTGLALVIGAIAVSYLRSTLEGPPLQVFGSVPDFALTNQLGRPVRLRDLAGQAWICDVIFTRCPTQCPLMTQLMAKIQKALPADEPVKLVSLTADPEYDRPDILRKYGEKYGAENQRWMFLTGDKPEINHLAASGLKFSVADKKPSERESEKDLFIHTTKVVLVDRTGRIRGWYSTEDGDSAAKIAAAARRLARESATMTAN